MATRTYCDHCGITITGQPERFSFGPSVIFMQHQAQAAQAVQNYGGGAIAVGIGGAGAAGNTFYSGPTYTTANPQVAIEQLDLCPRCVPIWMDRVKKLTSKSDVQDKQDSA